LVASTGMAHRDCDDSSVADIAVLTLVFV
jgi:hypothetical protein